MENPSAADLFRPTTFDDYIGQPRLKDELARKVRVAIRQQERPPHTLLCGPPGCGKTTLAEIVAGMLEVPCHTMQMPLTDANIMSFRKVSGVVFIDEIHLGNAREQDSLLSLLERGVMQATRNTPIIRPKYEFMIIAATTEYGGVRPALRDRFGFVPDWEPYSSQDMAQIGRGMAERIGVSLADDSDYELLANASDGGPRRLSHFIRTAFELYVDTDRTPTGAEILTSMGYTLDGLSPRQVRYLKTVYRGGTMGLDMIRRIMGMDDSGVKEIEQSLGYRGYITMTGRGRQLTADGADRAAGLVEEDEAAA